MEWLSPFIGLNPQMERPTSMYPSWWHWSTHDGVHVTNLWKHYFRQWWNSERIRRTLLLKRKCWYARSSSWCLRCDPTCFFLVFLTRLKGSSKSLFIPTIFAAKRFVIGELCPEDAFVTFLSDERDALVTQSVNNTLKICKKLEIPTEERLVRRNKRIPGEKTQDVGLSGLGEN